MSEYDTPQTKPWLKPAAGFLILGGAIWIVLFSGASSINRFNIEKRLQQFSESISQVATDAGKEGKFTYGNLTLEGWGYKKYGIVDNVSLELAEKTLLDTNRWTLSTTKMQVLPSPTMPDVLYFQFADPVNVIENSQLKTTILFSSPLSYGYYDGTAGHKHVIEHVLHLPKQITLVPAKNADASAEHEGKIVVTYDDNALISLQIAPEALERATEFGFENVHIDDEDGSHISIGGISSHLSVKRDSVDKRPHGQYNLMVKDFATRDNEKSTKAYSLSVEADFVGNQPFVKVAGEDSSEVTLHRLQLTDGQFRVVAEGKFTVMPDDPLPSGAVTLTIDNVQQLLSSELIPDQVHNAAVLGVEKITGQPLSALTNITVPLKREKGGALYIGNVTFEQLAAAMLAGMLQAAPQPVPPTLPPGAPPISNSLPAPPSAAPQDTAVPPQSAAPQEAQPSVAMPVAPETPKTPDDKELN